MKPIAKICFGLLLAAFANNLEARYVTLQVNSNPRSGGAIILTNEISIQTNEVAQIVSWSRNWNSEVIWIKDGITNWNFLYSGDINNNFNPIIFAGPAVLQLVLRDTNTSTYVTLKIDADNFPPDKTLIVPQGSGARISLESSTNLTHWVEAPPGSYTNVSVNMFFRIKAERVP